MDTHHTHFPVLGPINPHFPLFPGHVRTATIIPDPRHFFFWGVFTMLQNPYLPIFARKNLLRARPKNFEILQILKMF